jgi:hypothetical protein
VASQHFCQPFKHFSVILPALLSSDKLPKCKYHWLHAQPPPAKNAWQLSTISAEFSNFFQ